MPTLAETPERTLVAALVRAREDAVCDRDPEANPAVLAARHALVDKWRRLQWKQAMKWWRGNSRRGCLEDYVSAVRAGWWEASEVGRFDPSRGTGFSAYATWHGLKWVGEFAHAEACGLIRLPRHKGVPVVESVPVASFQSDPDGHTWEPPAREEPDPRPDPAIVWSAVDAAVADERIRAVLRARFSGMTLEECGRQFGVSKERIRQLLVRGMKELRRSESLRAMA